MTDIKNISIEQGKKARLMIDRAMHAFIEIDIKGVILDWNIQSERIFGWSYEEAVGKLLSDTIIPAAYREAHIRGLKHLQATGEGPVLNKTIELSACNRDGHEFPIELSVYPINLEGGSVTFCAFLTDISERKNAEKVLKEQAELLDLTYDAILMRDLDGTIHYWNRGAQKMYGFTAAEAMGKKTHHLLNTKFPKPLEEVEKDILNSGRWDGELLHYRQDGERLIISSRQALKTDATGQATGVLEINSDITANKQAEQRKLALAEMKRVNIELEQFAYVASHDLQEPLRAVAGGLQILEKKYKDQLDDHAHELIHMAVDGASRMRALITDLLSLSQIDSAQEASEATDLTTALHQAIENIAVTVKETGAIITQDALPVLTTEKGHFIQLFQNLLSNAIKFRSTDTPKIHISANCENGQWLFKVSDNGIGFEQEFAEHIFEPFKRLHTRDEYPGTGIGLPICKRIVERHGGSIWAESQPGKGTTFYFTIPDISKHPV